MRLSPILAVLVASSFSSASIYNLKIVTDANPDYTDLPSLVHSATSKWPTPEEKCWAMFYWNHIARRQTAPIELHGMALTDPIRQFNDYGYTMCSTISGIEQSIWEQMGLKHRYWDISNHTVAEVFYDGRWHMYDNSLSALYTLCDGKTLAGVEDIGKEGACEASHGKKEPGHIAKYHCLTSTSPNGFLTGADTARSLDEEYHCFNPNGLKLRTYFYDWDNGHRYILNLHPNATYTRNYHALSSDAGFYVPNHDKDPEKVNERYHLRGNGEWIFKPQVNQVPAQQPQLDEIHDVEAAANGLHPSKLKETAVITYRFDTANVATSALLELEFLRKTSADRIEVTYSTDSRRNGRFLWGARKGDDPTGDLSTKIKLPDDINGAYQIFIRITLFSAAELPDAMLRGLRLKVITELNSKTQPRLNLGKNTVYVGAGDQSDSIVLWPELQGRDYWDHNVQEVTNIASVKKHPGYQGAIYPKEAKKDAVVSYHISTPRDLTHLTYGGRFYNRAPKSRIEMWHSLDRGTTWTKSWSLTDTNQPWDVIHYESIEIPAGHRDVYVKYLMNSPSPEPGGCSIYAQRIEANYQPVEKSIEPVEVTFAWKEDGKDRSHTQLIDKLPFKYTINTAGDDHPVMESLTVNLKVARDNIAAPDAHPGLPAEKFVGTWQTLGKNLALGKKYTLSHASKTTWDAGDPDGTKLTDGIVGPTYAGGTSYRYGAIWDPKTNPTITLDLGEKRSCASFGLNFHGYAWHDALKGEVKDKVEVQVSDDGQNFTSIGQLKTDIKRKDIPVNFMLPDDETLTGHTFRLIPEKPISTRYVRYNITSDRNFCATELEVLDSIDLKPFDLRIALPDDKP